MEEISLNEIDDVLFGNAQDDNSKTGVTVAIFPRGARCGVDVSGGGPASRETPVLNPTTAPVPVNAIVLSGGSAYGLAAADGVMIRLEELGIGYETPAALVPIVVGSSIYDLNYGSATVRPDAEMGRAAVDSAFKREKIISGSFGAGTGATVGKICGMARAMKSGLGVYAVKIGALKIAALVVVNALGDIFDERTGEKIAGLLTADKKNFADTRAEFRKITETDLFQHTNTTLGIVITNGNFDRAQLTRLAVMTRNAFARSIKPVGTLADGDTIYAASVGTINADLNMVGAIACDVMSTAIRRSVTNQQRRKFYDG